MLLRVIKGIHGLHVYANEFWAETLLSFADLHCGVDSNKILSLHSMLNHFEVVVLGTTKPSSDNIGDKAHSKATDPRRAFFSGHVALQKVLEAQLTSQGHEMNRSKDCSTGL